MCWIISKKLRFAVLDKTCAKQRALLGCCLKLAPNRTSELSFCLKIYRINKKLKLVQDTARNCAIAWNWRQNALHNCSFSKNSSKQSAELQFYLNWLVRSETCRYLQIWNFCANQFCNYELLKIRVFCQKREDDNILTKYSHCLT